MAFSTFVTAQATTQGIGLSAPTGLRAIPRADGTLAIDSSWNSVPGANFYEHQRRPVEGGGWSGGDSYSTTYSSTSVNLQAGRTYLFRVMAKTGTPSLPTSYSPWSEEVTATARPDVTTGVAATADDQSQITITWNVVNYAQSYKIEWSANGTSGWQEAGTTGAVTTFTHTGLSANTRYYYRVQAIIAGTLPGAFSTVANATTAPAPPTNFSATPVSSSQINLSWTASTGATSYKLEWSANGASGWTTLAVSGTNTTYSHTGLTESTTYYYRLAAGN